MEKPVEVPSEIINPWKKERKFFGAMGAILAAYGVVMGVRMDSWVTIIGMPLFGLIFVAVFGVEYPYAVLCEAGVTYRFVFRPSFLPWKELIQVGICLFENKKAGGVVLKSYKLGLLLPSGVPKMPGQRISYYKNWGRIIYLPDTPEIRDYIIAHYGLLDFDEQADPRGFSIVVD